METSIWPPPPYLDPAERDRQLAALAAEIGGELHHYGASVQNRPLLTLRLPASRSTPTQATPPAVLCCANLHGIEWIGGLVALAFARATVTSGTSPFELRQRADIWIVPCANPDGYAATFVTRGDAPLARLRTNAHGVDLNRNFPRPSAGPIRWAPGAGSANPKHASSSAY